MRLPDPARILIETELGELAASAGYAVPPGKRIAIYSALGPAAEEDQPGEGFPPGLSEGDRARAGIAILTARRVLPLWEQACRETEVFFTERDWHDKREDQGREPDYLQKRKILLIEKFSAYDVPRAFYASHIIELAEAALSGRIEEYASLQRQAAEWWIFYGRPERNEREFFIKWAAQEALDLAIGIDQHIEPPAEHALHAFAGFFAGQGLSRGAYALDEDKQHEFWTWWLSSAIPLAFKEDAGNPGA